MNKANYSFLFLFLSRFLIAQQPANPLSFLNFKPKWSHYSYASTLPDSTQDHWQAFRKPLIVNNDLYLVMNNIDNFFQGHLLEKLDINTGEGLASHQQFNKEKNERHYVYSIKPHGDYIDMLFFKENSRNITPFIYSAWVQSNYNSYRFCANSLSVCDSTINNPLDTNNKIIKNGIFNSHLYYSENKVLNVECSKDATQKKAFYTVRILNKNGKMIDSTEVELFLKYSNIGDIQLYEYDEGKYISFVIATDLNDANHLEVKLIYFNADFEVEKVLDISEKIKNATLLYLGYEDNENFVVTSRNDSIIDNVKYRNYSYYIFNHNGEKLDEISFKNANLGKFEYMFGTLLKPSKKILTMVRKFTKDKNVKIEFMLSNNKGSADVIKTIYPNRHIRNYDIYSMPNNHILAYIRDADSTDIRYKKIPWRTHWVMFSPESLNIPLAIEDLNLPKFSFYPNPATEYINIQTDVIYDAVCLYSIEGKLVKKIENQHNRIDISSFPVGLYFLELRQKGRIVAKIEKFIKVE